MSFLAFTEADRWVPGIGDPTFIGWLTVVAYFAAFVGCLRVLILVKRGISDRRQFVFWAVMAFFMLALGINKQLDLQTWFTLTVKKMAKNDGWYEQRRFYQAAFIALIAVMGLGGIVAARWWTKRNLQNTSLALSGAVFLWSFVVIRAASFHSVDQMLGFSLAGFRMNWILELGGIALVAAGAWKADRYLRSPQSRSFVWVTADNRLGPS